MTTYPVPGGSTFLRARALGVLAPPSGDTSGVTDTAAINGLVQAGKAALLTAGTYYVGNLLPDSYGAIIGEGASTVLSAVAGTTGSVIALKTAASTQEVLIENLTVNCNSRSTLTGITLDNTGLSSSTPGYNRLVNVLVLNAGHDGFSFPVQSETFVSLCASYNAGRYGFNLATGCTDGRFVSCTSGPSASHGWLVTSSSTHYVACKAYYAGWNGSAFTTGHGWYVLGTSAYPVEGNTWSGCEAQDCAQQGWFFNPNSGTITACSLLGCVVDSCNGAAAGGSSGVGIYTDSLSYCTIAGNIVFNRSGGAGTMTYGLSVANVQTGTVIGPNAYNVSSDSVYYVSGYAYTLLETSTFDVSAVSQFKIGSPLFAAASPQALSNSSAITTAVAQGSYPLTASGAVTGLILSAPPNGGGSVVYLINQSAYTLTFAAAGTSLVADGTSDVIPALTSRAYIYDGNTSLWYRAA